MEPSNEKPKEEAVRVSSIFAPIVSLVCGPLPVPTPLYIPRKKILKGDKKERRM